MQELSPETETPSPPEDRTRLSVLYGIEERMYSLTPAQRRVVQVLRASYPESVFATADEISARADVSRATFVRTLAALGYPGLGEVQREVRRELADLLAPPDRWRSSATVANGELDLIQEIASITRENIDRTFAALPGGILEAAGSIAKADRVLVIGERKARTLATYLAVQLAQMRRDVVELGSSSADMALQLADLSQVDILVLFDLRRYGRITRSVGELARAANATVISVADSPRPPTARYADVLLTFETKTASPFLSYTAGLALLDALVALVVRYIGETGERYAIKVEEMTNTLHVFSGDAELVEAAQRARMEHE